MIRRSLMPWRIVLAMTLSLTASSNLLAQANPFGRIQIPARGIFDLRDGTVEAWVQLNFDPAQEEKGMWRGMGSWFAFHIPKSPIDLGSEMSVSYGLKNIGHHGKLESQCGMRYGWAIDAQEVPHPIFVDFTKAGKDQWHHVAVTWKEGRSAAVYVDGKPVTDMKYPVSLIRDIGPTALIILGARGYTPENHITIDDLRISAVARDPETLGFQQVPCKPDPVTLLLIDFEQIRESDGKRFVKPVVMATVGAPEEYEIHNGAITPGKSGQAFCLQP